MKTAKYFLLALLLTVSSTAGAQTKAEIRDILEQFCLEHYDDCYSPRQYIQNSLVVKSVDSKEWGFFVKGTHSYKGQYIPFLGRETHSNVDFKAELRPTERGLKVVFYKWYEPDIKHPDGFWEKCVKTIIPDY